jgi:Domain of unknown function (DUF4157)
MRRIIGNRAVTGLPHVSGEARKVERSTSAPTRFAHDFSRIPVYSKAPIGFQTKLTINSPGDIYEQEADHIAEQVTSAPEPQLQRTCPCGGGCPGCRNEQATHAHLQTKSIQLYNSVQSLAPPIVLNVLRSSGQSLEPSTREFMESRFGHDFSQVRVHTDAKAVESANALGARAYTVGQHIAFGAGQYSPHLMEGRRLLAHELTHTLQQRASTQLGGGVGSPANNTERTAEKVVNRNKLDSSIHVEPHAFLPALQRQSHPDDDPLTKTKKPTARASMLLQMFWKGVTNTGLSFTSSFESDFNTAANDADARVETIQAILNNANVTYTFIINNKTGFIHVREKDDGTGHAKYYQSGQSGEATTDATSQATSGKDDKSTKEDDPTSKKPPEAAPDSDEKAPPVKPPPSDDKKTNKKNPKEKSDCKIGETDIPGQFLVGVFDQTWLPGTNCHGEPAHQGDLEPDLEEALIKFAKRIKASACVPKELKISVTLFNDSGGPAPGYKYAAGNMGYNIKKFLEARLPTSIKVTETHKVVDPGKPPKAIQLHVTTITPVY